MLRNLNPDLSSRISESLGTKGDAEPLASTEGSYSLISLVKRVVSLLSVPAKARRLSLLLSPGISSVLVPADWGTREILVYNAGLASAFICLGSELATKDSSSYSLRPQVLVVESFSGIISAVSDQETRLIITVKS